MLPNEIVILKNLSHPNIIQYLDHMIETNFIVLITELHGTSWDVTNPKLSPKKNHGLKDKTDLNTEPQKGKSCDLFDCIDARMFT